MKSTEASQRMVPMPDGKRVALTLEEVTWLAIDHLAAELNTDWRKWCAGVLLRSPGSANLTREVRTAVTEALLARAVQADRQALMRRPQPALLALSGTFGDSDFDTDMQRARGIDGSEDYGGFELATGTDQFGRACIWIRNGLRNGPHCVIPLPFSPDQVGAAQEGRK